MALPRDATQSGVKMLLPLMELGDFWLGDKSLEGVYQIFVFTF